MDAQPEEVSGNALEGNWEEEYKACKTWGPVLQQMEDATQCGDSPQSFQLVDKRLYKNCLLCLPTFLTGRTVRVHRAESGHPAGDLLLNELGRWFAFAQPDAAKRLTQWFSCSCGVFQVSQPSKGPFQCSTDHASVPPSHTESVVIDALAMHGFTLKARPKRTITSA